MSRLAIGLIVACLLAGQAIGEENSAEAIRAFGLIGTWSVDCSKEPTATCIPDKGCGARTTYEVSSSGQPMIKNVVGTLVPGVSQRFETVIESAVRIADDKLKITSVQRGSPGDITKLAWFRQPGERWETIFMRVGNGYRVFSAQSTEARKVSAKDGFMYSAPRETKWNEMPASWIRGDRETPLFQKCAGEQP